MGKDFVRDRRVLERDANHLGAGHLAALADRIGDLAGFAEANAHAAAFVAHDYQGAEIKTASAFDDLGGAIDEDDLLGQFLFLALDHDFGRVRGGPVAPAAEGSARGAFFAVIWFDWFSGHKNRWSVEAWNG